jgi:hypothetical protein
VIEEQHYVDCILPRNPSNYSKQNIEVIEVIAINNSNNTISSKNCGNKSKKVKKTIFVCDFCNFKTNISKALERHKELYHKNEVTIKLDQISKQLNSVKNSVNSKLIEKISNSEEFVISVNNQHFDRPSVLSKLNGPKIFYCNEKYCSFNTGNIDIFKIHVKIHTNSSTNNSVLKNYSTLTEDQQIEKTLEENKTHFFSNKFICNEKDCSFRTESENFFESHKSAHLSEELIACDFIDCYYKTHTNKDLENHKFIIHTKHYQFICSQVSCNFSAKTSRYLRIHEFMKHRIKPILMGCDFGDCEFTTFERDRLLAHGFIHTKRFVCGHNDCKYKTRENYLLINHKRRCHPKLFSEVEDYECDHKDCNYKTKSNEAFIDHQKSHIESYICDEPNCGKKFSFADKLLIHKEKTHDKNCIECDFENCNKTFKDICDLRLHQKIHGIKKYVCYWNDCKREFSDNKSLKDHKNRHTGYKPYACVWPECGQRFFSTSARSKHKDSKHLVPERSQSFECYWSECDKQ